MYCFGTNCQCKQCGKKWTITYKDVLQYNNAIKKINTQAKLGAASVILSALSGNKLNSIDSSILTNAVVNNRNATLSGFQNGEFLQKDHCPECRSPLVDAEEFYYEADRFGNYIKPATKEDYDRASGKIHNKPLPVEYRRKDSIKYDIIWGIIIISIVLLVTLYVVLSKV